MLKKVLELLKKYREIIVYIIVGGLTTVVSYLSYIFFTRITGFDYQVSNVLSWVVSVTFAFFANKIYVFRSKTDTIGQFTRELINFVKYRILSLIIDVLLMYLLIDVFNINDLISKLIVQIIIVIINYVFSKLFVFIKK